MAANINEFKIKFRLQRFIGITILTIFFNLSRAGITPADLIETGAIDTVSCYNFGNSAGRSNSFYDTCVCDLTSNSCDINCCCDSDCSSDLTLKWQKGSYQCLNSKTNNNILSADKCYVRDRISDTEDFIQENFSVSTSTNFASQITNAEEDFSTPLSATTTTTPTLYSLGVDLYLSSGSTFKFPLPNTFGLCDQVLTVKFLKDINDTTCTRYTTLNTCDTNLKGDSYTSLTFYSQGTTITFSVKLK